MDPIRSGARLSAPSRLTMTRLFRRFFIIIWLTMAGSIATAFAVNWLLRSSPFVQELAQQRRVDLLQLTSAILQRDGAEAARNFAQAAAVVRPEIPLSIAEVSPSTKCASFDDDDAMRVAAGEKCYLLETEIAQWNPFARTILKLLPWVTALCASIVSAFWLTRYLIGPVDYLRQGLSGLANGRFDIRIGDKIDSWRDEMASLVHDFDTSAARLETLQATQQRLFHDVSHELRSPLSRLQAALGVLRQSPKKLEPMVERMEREIDRMDQLVEEILTLARLNTGALDDFERQAIDMIDLLTEIAGDAAFEARSRGIVVKSDLPRSFVAEVNGELIYRALENVVRNALKFTTENSTVTISAEIDGNLLHIAVIDEGAGVREGEIEKIFQPFARGEDPVRNDGFGLGLAIARQALERHGGRIAASPAASGGLKVTLTVPRQDPRPHGGA